MHDNGPEFSSSEYKQFAKDWDFDHDTSSPEYPQSNGFIERTIQTVNSTLKKALRNNEDPYLAILALRTTPQRNGMPSPATCLMKRDLRTILPSFNVNKKRGKPKSPKPSMLKQNYDQHAKEHKPLQPGATVRYRKHNTWSKKGRVVKKLSQPRSYQIETESGNIIRRNRRHLVNTRELFVPRLRHEIHIPQSVPPTLPSSAQPHEQPHKQSQPQPSTVSSTQENQPAQSQATAFQNSMATTQTDHQPYRTRSGRT